MIRFTEGMKNLEDEATFFSLSSEYLEAAETLNKIPPTKVNYWIITYYLLGHSAELSLKSFLFKRGMSLKELRKIGHDLFELLDKAKNHGIQDFNSIRSLSPIYKSKKLEYRQRNIESFPPIDNLILEVKELHLMVFESISYF
ncbi:hypothetical protein KIH87_14380 [Paraneptunicella aestuarii]|uniref:hypothetical protein n=1 Tax=Paraneptunicella aestuarii TaxID=2831148 RepID=UPI001E2FB1E2|nr:hypothetical protein [Paraneptunicella aestuarii]UAA37872.1 hypothetical protein KIH87_14380 [Paraneptunicella aestuarii]